LITNLSKKISSLFGLEGIPKQANKYLNAKKAYPKNKYLVDSTIRLFNFLACCVFISSVYEADLAQGGAFCE